MSLPVLSLQTNWSTAHFPPQGLTTDHGGSWLSNCDTDTILQMTQWLHIRTSTREDTHTSLRAAFCVKSSFLPVQF